MLLTTATPFCSCDFIAGHADDALDDVLLGVEREVEDDDVVLRDFAIGQQPSPDAGGREAPTLSTSRKSPTSSVRSMLSEGMRKGCTRKARMNSAATITIRAERTVSSRCGSTKWMWWWRAWCGGRCVAADALKPRHSLACRVRLALPFAASEPFALWAIPAGWPARLSVPATAGRRRARLPARPLLGGSGALRGDGGQLRRAGNDHFHQKALAVVRAGLRFHFVFGRRGAPGLQHLLQRGFVIAHAVAALQSFVEALRCGIDNGALHEGAGDVDSGIEIERGEHGLKAVGEQHGLVAAAVALLAAAEAEVVAEMQRLRHIAEMPAADQRGAQPGEVAFLKIGKRFVQRLRDERPSTASPRNSSFSLSAGACPGPGALLKGERAVGDRLFEQCAIVEAMLQGALERFQRALAHGCGSPSLLSLFRRC